MNELRVLPVLSRREREVFLTFPWRIFKGDPLWVPPLLPDWRERIDPQRGVFFKRGAVFHRLERRKAGGDYLRC